MPRAGDDRERWSNDVAFVLAAMGSAVGLGNFWRFPATAAANGGGQFFVPYLLSLFLIGLPLLLLELSAGQRFQSNAFDAFASINARAKGVGLAASLCGTLLVIYYMAIIAWTLVYFVYSFQVNGEGQLPWAGREAAFFVDNVLHLAPGPGDPTGPVPGPVAGMVCAWVITAFCIVQGPKTMSWVVYVTMPLPIICLAVLIGRAATLPGAGAGIDYYLNGSPLNPNPLANPRLWSAALEQIFFSLSVAFGIMPTYGSYVPRAKSILRNGLVVAISNSAVSFLAGFCVFGALGFLADRSGLTMDELLASNSAGGGGLAFITFPAILATLPDARNFFAAVFFLMLFTLGLDSAFSLVEAVAAIVKDHLPRRVRAEYVAPALCALLLLCGLPFTTPSGLYYVDIVDWYVTKLALIVGLVEVVAFAWFFGDAGLAGGQRFREQVVALQEEAKGMLGTASDAVAFTYVVLLKFVTAPLLLVAVAVALESAFSQPVYGLPLGWQMVGGVWLILGVAIIVGMAFVPYTPFNGREAHEERKGGSVAVRL